MDSATSRRLAAAAAIVALCAGSVRAVRGSYKPYAPDAPSYRQFGPADAPVTIAEFSDFQCPSCAMAVDSVRKLEEMHRGKLRVIYKHHPWWFHPYAKQAAVFAECAGMQGKFWPVYDVLFAHQEDWARSNKPEDLFSGYAKQAGVDEAALSACRAGPAAAAAVEADLRESDDHWVQSTPTFFVNGRRCAGVRQLLSTGVQQIDRLLPPARGGAG